MNYRVVELEKVDSTNEYIKREMAEDAGEGLIVIARKQTNGKGRNGRHFYSSDDHGIYMSILLNPVLVPETTVRVTALSAVVAARAIEKASGINAYVKWVNDIYLNGKKVCGILAEGVIIEERFSHVILGIGINVGRQAFPKEIQGTATSVLNELPDIVTDEDAEKIRKRIIDYFISDFFTEYDRLEENRFLEEYRSRSFLVGKTVNVFNIMGNDGDIPDYEGVVTGIDDNFSLIVRKKDGTIVHLDSGEARVRKSE